MKTHLIAIVFGITGCAQPIVPHSPEPCGRDLEVKADYASIDLPKLGSRVEIKGATFHLEEKCYDKQEAPAPAPIFYIPPSQSPNQVYDKQETPAQTPTFYMAPSQNPNQVY
jgi:hypothetical protein